MIATYGFRATMTAKPGKGDDLVDFLLSGPTVGPATHADCIVFLVSRSAANADVIHLIEGWTSKAVHDQVFASAEAQAFTARIGELLHGEVQFTDDVPVGGKAKI